MNNWIEDNKTKSIIIYTITIIGATWASLFLLLDERKEKLHETEIALKQTEIDNKKMKIDQLESRIELLELENTELKIKNNNYYEMISKNPKSIEFLETQINKLEKDNKVLQSKFDSNLVNPQNSPFDKQYIYSSDILRTGETFTDPFTDVTIAITYIYSTMNATGIITKPGSGSENFNEISAGYVWKYEKSGKKFALILKKLDYVTQRFIVEVREEKN